MPVKADKFTLIPGNLTPPTGGSGFLVSGLGFRPSLVVAMSCSLSAENTWDTTPGMDGCMAILSDNTVASGTNRTGLTESWNASIKPHSFWSNSGVMWFRETGGAAIYLSAIHDDGFYVGYADGFEGGYGKICYYLAIGGTGADVAQAFGYEGASMPVTVGFEPAIYMVLGSGGLSGGAGDIAFADFDVPSWAFGGFDNQVGITQTEWMANGLAHAETVEQQRWFLDGGGDQWVMDGFTASQILGNTAYFYGRSATTFSIGETDGFPGGINTRVSAHFMSDTLFAGGAFTPNDVGTPLEVDTTFEPECVIFLAPQTNHGNFFGIPWGGRCFGFLTKDFQCCIAFGAQQRANDNDPIGRVASFCTSDFSWISNFTSDEVSDPTNPNYGTAEITPNGFTVDALALPKFNQYVRYVAYAPDEPGSGFFRILG